MEFIELRYGRGSATCRDLQLAVDILLADLEGEECIPEKIRVTEEGQGIDPLTTSIIVGIGGNVASHYLIKTWETRIWPLIRDRLGDDALGARKDDD